MSRRRSWITWEQAREAFAAPTDLSWESAHSAVEPSGVSDPWERFARLGIVYSSLDVQHRSHGWPRLRMSIIKGATATHRKLLRAYPAVH